MEVRIIPCQIDRTRIYTFPLYYLPYLTLPLATRYLNLRIGGIIMRTYVHMITKVYIHESDENMPTVLDYCFAMQVVEYYCLVPQNPTASPLQVLAAGWVNFDPALLNFELHLLHVQWC